MTAADSSEKPAPFRPDTVFYRYVHPKLADDDGWPNSGAFDDDELSGYVMRRCLNSDSSRQALIHR